MRNLSHNKKGSSSASPNDWYGSYTAEPATDPSGPANGSYRIQRGGSSLRAESEEFRSAKRNYDDPQYRFDWVGFRVV
jgi:sulfatase modifying factor 1